MSASKKATRSSIPKKEPIESPKTKAPALFKVFYIAKSLLKETGSNLNLERFYHPGRNSQAWFITQEDKTMLEVIEFSEPRRSWLINNDVCSNGRIYMTTPIDITFLVLHQLRKYCMNKALELETIHDEKDPSVKRLMTKFVGNASLNCISDIKSVGDMTFYKYNPSKALAWLAIKTKRLADCLKSAGIHCGRSALSQNYMRSEKAAEEPVHDIDFLRMACDIICGYLDLDLHAELTKFLNIPAETIIGSEDKDTNGKRKSLTTLKATKNKKLKVNKNNDEDEDKEISQESNGATGKLKRSQLLDESLDNDEVEEIENFVSTSPVKTKPTPLKERVLTTKEKKLAIGAKGTKSIASFFKK